MIAKLIVGCIGGFALHWARHIVDYAVSAPGWNKITHHVVGIVAVYPLARALFGDDDAVRMRDGARFDVSYWLAFFAVGLGVAIAQFVESAWHNRRRQWGTLEVHD